MLVWRMRTGAEIFTRRRWRRSCLAARPAVAAFPLWPRCSLCSVFSILAIIAATSARALSVAGSIVALALSGLERAGFSFFLKSNNRAMVFIHPLQLQMTEPSQRLPARPGTCLAGEQTQRVKDSILRLGDALACQIHLG